MKEAKSQIDETRHSTEENFENEVPEELTSVRNSARKGLAPDLSTKLMQYKMNSFGSKNKFLRDNDSVAQRSEANECHMESDGSDYEDLSDGFDDKNIEPVSQEIGESQHCEIGPHMIGGRNIKVMKDVKLISNFYKQKGAIDPSSPEINPVLVKIQEGQY
jgi:hypothetical protein